MMKRFEDYRNVLEETPATEEQSINPADLQDPFLTLGR